MVWKSNFECNRLLPILRINRADNAAGSYCNNYYIYWLLNTVKYNCSDLTKLIDCDEIWNIIIKISDLQSVLYFDRIVWCPSDSRDHLLFHGFEILHILFVKFSLIP